MTTLRGEHDKDHPYARIQNAALCDSRLTWKARGVLAYLLSKPNDWKVIAAHLKSQSDGDSRVAVQGALDELLSLGYLTRTGSRTGDGKFRGYSYDVYESPGQTVVENQQRNRCRFTATVKTTTSKEREIQMTELQKKEEDFSISVPIPDDELASRRAQWDKTRAALKRRDSQVTLAAPKESAKET